MFHLFPVCLIYFPVCSIYFLCFPYICWGTFTNPWSKARDLPFSNTLGGLCNQPNAWREKLRENVLLANSPKMGVSIDIHLIYNPKVYKKHFVHTPWFTYKWRYPKMDGWHGKSHRSKWMTKGYHGVALFQEISTCSSVVAVHDNNYSRFWRYLTNGYKWRFPKIGVPLNHPF